MDSKTKHSLESLTEESRALRIADDCTLTTNDIHEIAKIIAACPRLDSLAIDSCYLSFEQISILLPIIQTHPSLTKVSFYNNLIESDANCASLLHDVMQNPRIHTIDIRRNLEKPNTKKTRFSIKAWKARRDVLRAKRAFLNELQEKDTLVHVLADWWFEKEVPWLLPSDDETAPKNIVDLGAGSSDNKGYKGNAWKGNFLQHDFRWATFVASNKLSSINERLPLLVFNAEEKGERSALIKKILELNGHPESTGKIEIDRFITLNDALDIGLDPAELPALQSAPNLLFGEKILDQPVTLPKLTETKPLALPTLSEVMAGIEPKDTATLRAELEAGRDNPQMILAFGKAAFDTVERLALLSLQAANVLPSTEEPLNTLANFLDDLSESKALLEAFLEGDKKKQGRNPLRRKPQPTDQMRLLASAGGKADHAGKMLQQIVPVLGFTEKTLSAEIMASQLLASAYHAAAENLTLHKEAAETVLEEWTADNASGNTAPFTGLLETQLLALEQTSAQTRTFGLRHQERIRINATQLGCLALIRRSNLPLLAGNVSELKRDIGGIQRASLIQGIVDATQISSEEDGRLKAMASLKTIEAAQQLGQQTGASLRTMTRAIPPPPAPHQALG